MLRERLVGEDLERYLESVTAALVDEFGPERVVLFGSLARGDQNRASDVDLIVIARTELPFIERIGRALEACSRVSKRIPVDVLVYTPAEWQQMVEERRSFARLVRSEGRVLYDAGSECDGGKAVAPAGAPRP